MGILSVFFYAGNFFLTHRALVFPFPLNEFIYFITALAIAWNNKDKFPTESKLLFGLGFFLLVSNFQYWGILFSAEQLVELDQGVLPDVLLIVSKIIFSIFLMFTRNKRLHIVYSIGLLLLFWLGSVMHNSLFELISVGVFFSLSFKELDSKPYLNWLILYFVLELTKLWSLSV